MKFLVLFATSIDSKDDRIAGWIERELPRQTVAIDINEMNHPEPLQHYIDWSDRIVLIGQPDRTIIKQITHKPHLRLFKDGALDSTTVHFDEPETDSDRQLKSETLERLREFAADN